MLIYGNESLSHLVEELHLVLVLVDLGVETLEETLYEVSFTHADSATSLLYLLKIVWIILHRIALINPKERQTRKRKKKRNNNLNMQNKIIWPRITITPPLSRQPLNFFIMSIM